MHAEMIYLVDDDPTNLIVGRNALLGKYQVVTLPSGEKLLAALEKHLPSLILLDVEMPGMDGYTTIRHIKGNPRTADIPVIFLTGKTDMASELEGLSLGAIDYVTKPFSPPLLLKRIELHLLVRHQQHELQHYADNLAQLVEVKTRAVLTLQSSILKTVAELVEWRDDMTGAHIERTQYYLELLTRKALEYGLYKEEIAAWDLKVFLHSSLLHDVGKITIRDSLLSKPGKLTSEEFEEIKVHTTVGVEIIEKISSVTADEDFLEHARIFAGCHHEKWDGTGYPNGLSGLDIPLQGRLMAIADVYDALISTRPYKKAFPHEVAVQSILAERGKHFDPQLVDLFALAAEEFRIINHSS